MDAFDSLIDDILRMGQNYSPTLLQSQEHIVSPQPFGRIRCHYEEDGRPSSVNSSANQTSVNPIAPSSPIAKALALDSKPFSFTSWARGPLFDLLVKVNGGADEDEIFGTTDKDIQDDDAHAIHNVVCNDTALNAAVEPYGTQVLGDSKQPAPQGRMHLSSSAVIPGEPGGFVWVYGEKDPRQMRSVPKRTSRTSAPVEFQLEREKEVSSTKLEGKEINSFAMHRMAKLFGYYGDAREEFSVTPSKLSQCIASADTE